MKNQLSKILVFYVLIACFLSCNSTKRVAEDKYLLTNNTVVINDKTESSETINNLIDQKPNRKILGIPLRLHIYNLAREKRDSLFETWLDKNPKRRERLTRKLSKKQLNKLKESSLGFNKWLKKTGEAPVVVDEEKTEKTVNRFQNYHINNGWFDVNTTYNIDKYENKKAKIEYRVETGKAFIIDSISETVKSPIIKPLYQSIKRDALIKTNAQYKTSNFEQERDRISTELRNSGIYHFNQDYVSFEIDTIGTNKKINIGILIQDRAIRTPDSIRREPFEIYKIKDVNIFTDYTFENRNKTPQDTINFNGYTLYSNDKMRYNPKAITDALFITPDGIFKDIDRTRTYKHLNQLRIFKYPSIEYIENPDNTLTTNIRLSPLKKFSLALNADVSQSNIQSVGFSLNPSLQIRNIFKGAETLQVSAFGSIGASKDANKDEGVPFFDINEFGVDLKLTIPRLFFPFNTERVIPKYMSPNTKISLATTSQTNIGLDKQTFTGIINYNWFPDSKVTNKLDLFNAQYVRNLNPDNYFGVYSTSFDRLNDIALSLNYNGTTDLDFPEQTDAFINDVLNENTSLTTGDADYITVSSINERKNRLTEDNLILSSSFSFTQDNRKSLFDDNFSIFRFKLELAGNLLSNVSKLIGLEKDSDNRYELFNVAFSQYAKTEFDYIKHWDLGKKNVLAMRSFFGIAIPYGNSNNIPFSKSFFGGGPNDNRAWTAYSLGPGSSETTDEFNEANLKLALSIEQRFNIFENLNGAIFADAGNIWNVLDDTTDENATFTGFNSLKDIAVGSGFGLRYDFSFFVFRFDIGFKTYDPFYQDNNRWFNDYNFAKAVYNIGINYPF